MLKTSQSFIILNTNALCSHRSTCTDNIVSLIFSTQCIQEGVRYLMRMLQVRNSVKLNDGVVLHDTATGNVLSEGKFGATSRWECRLCPGWFRHTDFSTLFSHQASSQTHTSWQWCTSEKCVSGQSSTRTAAPTPQSAKKIVSNSGTSGHKSSTNTCWPARALCRAKAGTQKMPRKYLAFYSELSCSCVGLKHSTSVFNYMSSPKKKEEWSTVGWEEVLSIWRSYDRWRHSERIVWRDQCLLATSSHAKQPRPEPGEGGWKVIKKKKNRNNHQLWLESRLSSNSWICWKSSFILIPDCWLGHLFCSKECVITTLIIKTSYN